MKKAPCVLRQILETPLRKRHRAELFEMYFIMKESMPHTDDRLEIRQRLLQLYKQYKQEYRVFLVHRDQVKELEKTQVIPEESVTYRKILDLHTPLRNKGVIYRRWQELSEMDKSDPEYSKCRTWLDWALRLPYDRIASSPEERSIGETLKRVQTILDEELYGLKTVKEFLCMYLYQKMMYPEKRGMCLGLVGGVGVGKTTIARCLARILDFPFEQISCGGMTDTDHLRGFDYTYVGSQPGEIVKAMVRMEAKNGILFFDEFEKIADTPATASFLLHATDFSQNSTFHDAYFSDLDIDLSRLWFIFSMNDLPADRALSDRIFFHPYPGVYRSGKVDNPS